MVILVKAEMLPGFIMAAAEVAVQGVSVEQAVLMQVAI